MFQKYKNYEIIRGDVYSTAIKSIIRKKETPKAEVKDGNSQIYFREDIMSEEDINEFIYNIVKQMEIETEGTNQKIILEANDISVEKAIEYFRKDFDIYCLGMPNETVENLAYQIRENDEESDWTNYLGDNRLKTICKQVIQNSKNDRAKCEKYGINFFDTSGNRNEKVSQIIKEIEVRSIS